MCVRDLEHWPELLWNISGQLFTETLRAIVSTKRSCYYSPFTLPEWVFLISMANLRIGNYWITEFISTSTQLHPTPPSSFQSPPSSLQHPQQYLNQNIARTWAISPNLGRKIKRCPFWLKIGTHGMLEILIPNPDLDFWNSDPKINFGGNLCPKIQSCLFFLNSISRIVSQEC